jgi:uncharacterized membrane protein
MKATELFSDTQIAAIEAAIGRAEKKTSGEIRLYIEDHSEDEVLDRAAYLFEKLGMHKTALRNGVLIYMAVKDHTFAILGDAGINAVVPVDFWDSIKDNMAACFKKGEFEKGLTEGILAAGRALAEHFPPATDGGTNELDNEVIIR